jgi:hypothetical protein
LVLAQRFKIPMRAILTGQQIVQHLFRARVGRPAHPHFTGLALGQEQSDRRASRLTFGMQELSDRPAPFERPWSSPDGDPPGGAKLDGIQFGLAGTF